MRCAIYRRVSTEMQREEGYSLEAQKSRLISYAESQGWTVVGDYSDEGVSAKNMERPALQRLLRDMKKGHFDVILTYKLDRLVRSVGDLNELLTMFDKNNVKYKSATEMFDTTSAMGRFFIMIVGAMAQWERENLAERVKLGMTRRHEEGQRNGAKPPYGYNLIDGALVVNEEEAKWVRFIFDSYASKGRRTIAVDLNNRGLRTKEGNTWNDFNIHYIATNPVYYGSLRWNYRKLSGAKTGEEIIVDGDHEGIITKEKFDEVQSIRVKRKGTGFRSDTDYPYTGVLRCARCGGTMYGSRRKRKDGYHRYYKCMNRFKSGTCNMPILPEEVLDEELVKKLDMNNTEINEIIEIKKNDELNIDEITSELKRIEKAKQKLKTLFTWDDITESEYKNEMETLKDRELELNRMTEKKEAITDVSEYILFFESLPLIWGEMEFDERKKFLTKYIKSIVVDITKEVVGGPGNKPDITIKDYQMR
jgi:site-specific DNA recombinase